MYNMWYKNVTYFSINEQMASHKTQQAELKSPRDLIKEWVCIDKEQVNRILHVLFTENPHLNTWNDCVYFFFILLFMPPVESL